MPGQQLGSRVERHITEVSSSPIILHKHIAPGSILNIHYSTMNELHKRIYKLIELTTSNGICMCFNGVSRCHLHVGTIETSILQKKKSLVSGPKKSIQTPRKSARACPFTDTPMGKKALANHMCRG
jgi:hypothetical protein